MKTICIIRDIYKALSTFEENLEKRFGLSLNEIIILCCLKEAGEAKPPTAIAEQTQMTPSNTSKVIGSIESKGYIKRSLGVKDKRMMYISLTSKGRALLEKVEFNHLEVPELLTPILKSKQ